MKRNERKVLHHLAVKVLDVAEQLYDCDSVSIKKGMPRPHVPLSFSHAVGNWLAGGSPLLTDETKILLENGVKDETTVEAAKAALDLLTDRERADMFLGYCRECGCKDPSCPCWNDE